MKKKMCVKSLAQYLRLKMLAMMTIMKKVMVAYAALCRKWRYRDDQGVASLLKRAHGLM